MCLLPFSLFRDFDIASVNPPREAVYFEIHPLRSVNFQQHFVLFAGLEAAFEVQVGITRREQRARRNEVIRACGDEAVVYDYAHFVYRWDEQLRSYFHGSSLRVAHARFGVEHGIFHLVCRSEFLRCVFVGQVNRVAFRFPYDARGRDVRLVRPVMGYPRPVGGHGELRLRGDD